MAPSTAITAEETLAKLATAIVDLGKKVDDMSSEMAKRPAANTTQRMLGVPANPLAFLPGSDGTYPPIVTASLFPHLHPDVITQISKFDFPPAQLGRLLPSASVAAPQGLLLVAGANGEVRLVPSSPVPGAAALLREVPDILAFVEAWTIFTTVLQNEKPGLPVTQALLGYLSNVITNARVFAWPTVLDYHVAFVQLRARDPYFTPEDWTTVSPTLHTIHLLTPSVLSARLPSTLGPSPDRAARLAQICFAFNGAGCTATACFRRHICRICEAEGHTEKMCSGPPPAVV
ncbi:hypothetical protein K438DRAFT_2001998 [Mycena galopus ATCC 62051]|nr:hypothetical protein K438DRAFT_2001998 [Mycena galopus ATCC 62051]